MIKPTLLDTLYATVHGLQTALPQASQYLIKYAPTVILDQQKTEDLAGVKIYASSPIVKIQQALMSSEKYKSIAVYFDFRTATDTPSILTIDGVTINGRSVSSTPIPALLQKCWVNLTPYLGKGSSTYNGLMITDQTAVAELLVRAACCTGYDMPGMWLHPQYSTFMIEFYSKSIADTFGQLYNLTMEEKIFVQTMFATYYAQCLGDDNGKLDIPPLILRCSFLGSAADIVGRLEMVRDCRPNNGDSMMTPTIACACIQKHGPSRMKDFDARRLYRIMSASTIDSAEMTIGLDYPPYWLWQMLRLCSGHKNPLLNNIVKLGNMKSRLNNFADEVANQQVLLNKLPV